MARHREPRKFVPRAEMNTEITKIIGELVSALAIHPLTAKLLAFRGIQNELEARTFLSPKLESLTPPDRIRDMGKAVERLAHAREKYEKIVIFSDYDVDGTCGGALLTRVLREYGFTVTVTQPDRFKDGYGLNVGAVEEVAGSGANILITVDCGISSFDAANRAHELGVDLIVVDHHQVDPEKGIPKAYAVINPQRPDCESGLKQLCGCGLAFYLAIALRLKAREEKWFGEKSLPNLKAHLDLVTIATAADQVPLTGDNRILVKFGLDLLKRSTKPGIRALLESAGLGTKDLSPSHLGFTLGPRINASGRIAHAGIAMELLLTDDVSRAWMLAQELERLNKERMEIQNRIWDQIRERLESEVSSGLHPHAVVVGDPSWHEGVIGIVASRVTEHFRKPAVVISFRDGKGKGSVRSYGGKDVLTALRASATHLLGFGGHFAAAGLTIDPAKLHNFSEAFNTAIFSQDSGLGEAPLLIDGEISPEDLNLSLFEEIEKMAPFGNGNPEPVFVLHSRAEKLTWLKERHLKMWLTPGISALWFHADPVRAPIEGKDLSLAVIPEINRFRGQMTPQLRVRELKKNVPG